MPEYQRRASDRVDPDVLLAINEGDADNRHLLRNEFAEGIVTLRADIAAVKQDVQAGNFADVTEFAQIKAQQHEIITDVAELRRDVDGLDPRVRKLETGAAISQEMTTIKRLLVGALLLPTVVGIIVGVVLFSLHG